MLRVVLKGASIRRDCSACCQHDPTEPVTRPYAHCIHTDTKSAHSRFVAHHPHSGWRLPPNPFFALLPSSSPSFSFVIMYRERNWKGYGSGDSGWSGVYTARGRLRTWSKMRRFPYPSRSPVEQIWRFILCAPLRQTQYRVSSVGYVPGPHRDEAIR